MTRVLRVAAILGLGLQFVPGSVRAVTGDEAPAPASRSLWDPRLRDIVSEYESRAFRFSENRASSFRLYFWPRYEPAGRRDKDMRLLFGKASLVYVFRSDPEVVRIGVDPPTVKGKAFFLEVGRFLKEAIVPASFERYDGQKSALRIMPDRIVATLAPIERWPSGAPEPAGAHAVITFGPGRAPERFDEYDSRGRLIETREYSFGRVADQVAVNGYSVTPATADPQADRKSMRILYGAESEGDVFPDRLEYTSTRPGMGRVTIQFVQRGVEKNIE